MDHLAGKAHTSDWSLNNFQMGVYGNMYLIMLWTKIMTKLEKMFHKQPL